MLRFRLLAILAVALFAGSSVLAATYSARFGDDQFLESETIRDWHDQNATPRLGSKALLNDSPATFWIQRDDAAAPPDGPRVELIGGDRLPGVVSGARQGDESSYRRLPAHLLVEALADLLRPGTDQIAPFRVELRFVSRVIWQAGEIDIPPATAVLRDGRRFAFRSVRWEADRVTLLTAEGVLSFSYSELAEIKLPTADAWQAHLDALGTLLPNGEGKLVRVAADNGFAALTSLPRFRAETHGDNRRPEHWYQVVQPAWSLDPFWLRFPSISTWRLFAANEVPLPLLDPDVIREGVVFSGALYPRTDQTVGGRRLSIGSRQAGWGFGLQAPCTLRFRLPAAARSLRAWYGLDASVADGGCVRAHIAVQPTMDNSASGSEQQLYRSQVLIGETLRAFDTGRIAMAAPAGDLIDRALVLTVESEPATAPAGTDPYDIRDAFNWLDPLLELESAELRRQVRERAMNRLPGLVSWQGRATDDVRVLSHWDTRDWENPQFRNLAIVDSGFVLFEKTLRAHPEERFLALFGHCPHGDFQPARVQVRINGRVEFETELPTEHGRREPDPVLVPLPSSIEQAMRVEVIQLPGTPGEKRPPTVDWRGIGLVMHRPGLLHLWGSEAASRHEPNWSPDTRFFPALTRLADEAGLLHHESRAAGAKPFLTVRPPGFAWSQIDGWNAVITAEPDLGEYRYLQILWRRRSGEGVAVSLAHNGEFGVGDAVLPPAPQRRRPPQSDDRGLRSGYRYAAGPVADNDPRFSPAVRIDPPPTDRDGTLQRDLFNDFGAFSLTGFGVATNTAELWIADIALARATDQFKYLSQNSDTAIRVPPPGPTGSESVAFATQPEEYAALVRQAMPGFGLSGQGGDLLLLNELHEQDAVLRTHPQGQAEKQAVRLTRVVDLNEIDAAWLTGAVAPHDGKDCQIECYIDGESVWKQTLNASALEAGWHRFKIDLSRYSGREVRLELRHSATGWDHEYAYWHDVRLHTSDDLPQ